MIKVINFQLNRDMDRLEEYLRSRYLEGHNANSWLPERLHDLIFRVGAQEMDEGRKKSADFIFLWEDHKEIGIAFGMIILS